jgi:hypothetical protein
MTTSKSQNNVFQLDIQLPISNKCLYIQRLRTLEPEFTRLLTSFANRGSRLKSHSRIRDIVDSNMKTYSPDVNIIV